jgi:hypothetical protein
MSSTGGGNGNEIGQVSIEGYFCFLIVVIAKELLCINVSLAVST